MLPNEVFLSHASQDRNAAIRLAQVIREHGIPVWLCEHNIAGAQQWHDEIGAALRRCDWFAVILSPDSVESTWVKREVLFALQQNHYENRIIPVLLRPCDHERLSWVLSIYQRVDFTDRFEKGCQELLRVWGVGYRADHDRHRPQR